MICPCCGKEMEKGNIQSTRRMLWTTNLRKFLIVYPKRNEIVFLFGRKPYRCTAYHCKSCKKIVMDYGDGIARYIKG